MTRLFRCFSLYLISVKSRFHMKGEMAKKVASSILITSLMHNVVAPPGFDPQTSRTPARDPVGQATVFRCTASVFLHIYMFP